MLAQMTSVKSLYYLSLCLYSVLVTSRSTRRFHVPDEMDVTAEYTSLSSSASPVFFRNTHSRTTRLAPRSLFSCLLTHQRAAQVSSNGAIEEFTSLQLQGQQRSNITNTSGL